MLNQVQHDGNEVITICNQQPVYKGYNRLFLTLFVMDHRLCGHAFPT